MSDDRVDGRREAGGDRDHLVARPQPALAELLRGQRRDGEQVRRRAGVAEKRGVLPRPSRTRARTAWHSVLWSARSRATHRRDAAARPKTRPETGTASPGTNSGRAKPAPWYSWTSSRICSRRLSAVRSAVSLIESAPQPVLLVPGNRLAGIRVEIAPAPAENGAAPRRRAPGRGSHRCRIEDDRLDRVLPRELADRSDELGHRQGRLVAEVEGAAGDPVGPGRLGQSKIRRRRVADVEVVAHEAAVAAWLPAARRAGAREPCRGRSGSSEIAAAVDVAAARDRDRETVCVVVRLRDEVLDGLRDLVRMACGQRRVLGVGQHRSRRTPCRSKRRRRAARGPRGGGRPRAGCTCRGRSTPRCRAARAGQRRRASAPRDGRPCRSRGG